MSRVTFIEGKRFGEELTSLRKDRTIADVWAEMNLTIMTVLRSDTITCIYAWDIIICECHIAFASIRLDLWLYCIRVVLYTNSGLRRSMEIHAFLEFLWTLKIFSGLSKTTCGPSSRGWIDDWTASMRTKAWMVLIKMVGPKRDCFEWLPPAIGRSYCMMSRNVLQLLQNGIFRLVVVVLYRTPKRKSCSGFRELCIM